MHLFQMINKQGNKNLLFIVCSNQLPHLKCTHLYQRHLQTLSVNIIIYEGIFWSYTKPNHKS